MPIMDGNEATLFIRNTQNLNSDVPIIALTASALLDKKTRSAEIGMTDFVTKPFNPNQLLEKLNLYLTSDNGLKQTAIPPSVSEQSEPHPSHFSFNRQLDVSYLNEFYEDDWTHAADMFDTFLTVSSKDVEQLPHHLLEENWTEFSQLAHKTKPIFSMVGLTSLSNQSRQQIYFNVSIKHYLTYFTHARNQKKVILCRKTKVLNQSKPNTIPLVTI